MNIQLRTAQILLLSALVALAGSDASAQVVPSDTVEVAREVPIDTVEVARELAADTVEVTTPGEVDLTAEPAVGPPTTEGDGLTHPIRFSARDSLVVVFGDVEEDGDIGTLYGEARTEYDDAVLTAHEIELLFQRELLRARGRPDEDAVDGRPAFQRGQESFTGRELAYNLTTQRGRVVGARTAVDDGYILGGSVVQVGDDLTYGQDVIYTTCPYDEHQHWGIHTHRMKVVDGEWVYTGAAQLYILGIPTPVWLPFGFFPAAEGRRSGPLPPEYGEQMDLGFYLRNVGYYWALSDHFDLQLSGGFYTSGSYEGQSDFRYARRYRYDGALHLGYRSERRGEAQDPGFAAQTQAEVRWRHNQTLDAVGNTRLAGNVNLRTAGYARNAMADYDDRVQQTTTSNLNLTQRWRSGRNLNVSYRQTLNLQDGSTSLTLPTVSFNQPRLFPFRRTGGSGQRWYEQVGIQYSFSGENQYVFPAAADTSDVNWLEALFSQDAYHRATGQTDRFNARATHNIPISASLPIRGIPLIEAMQLNLSPNLSYREEWFASRREARITEDGFVERDDNDNILFDTVQGFTAIRQTNLGVSASTRVFGTFPWRLGRFDGFRHEMRPSASFTFAPDLAGAFWGRLRSVTEPDGNVVEYAVRQDVSAQSQPQRAMSLSLTNVFQTRVVSEDAAGAESRRIVPLLNLDINTGYNFAADSLNWRDINIQARSTIADQVSVSLSASYSPYAVNEAGSIQNQYYFDQTGRPLRFLRANLSASTQLRGGQGGGSPSMEAPAHRPVHIADLDPEGHGLYPYDYRRPDLGFVDFEVPWSLGLDFNYGVTRNFFGGDDNVHATLNSSFDLGVTSNWRVSGRTGFDFDRMDFVPTQVSVLRDLHCWEMSFTWLPFGQVRAFTFSIYVKSGHLRDLLRLDVPNVDRTPYF